MTDAPIAPDQNWYAVALADDIAEGRVAGADLFDGRVVVYRRADGAPVVLSARCPHMGADLALGDVVGDDIRCTFHHFCFGPDGDCTAIPSDDTVPAKARVTSFPTAERWGLIWAFNGTEPLFDAPRIRDYDDDTLAVRARRTDLFPVEPWVIMGNSFDFSHLRYVHRLVFDDPDDIRWSKYDIEYDLTFKSEELGTFEQRIRNTGTNTVSYVTTGAVDSMGLFTSTPTPNGSQSYYIAATPEAVDGEASSPSDIETRLALQETLADELLKDDTRAFSGMRFKEGTFVGADRHLRKYFAWVHNFPKHQPDFD
jgi:phenylpropionate dioxygenase-like ring-hydroxylating dioxygenase large terminal subunit